MKLLSRKVYVYIYTHIYIYILGFPGGSAGKESTCKAGGLGSVPGLGRSPGEGKGYPRQYSGLENTMDYMVHGVAKSWTQLCNFPFLSFSPRRMLYPLRRGGEFHPVEAPGASALVSSSGNGQV